jgi:hypothetical protein
MAALAVKVSAVALSDPPSGSAMASGDLPAPITHPLSLPPFAEPIALPQPRLAGGW